MNLRELWKKYDSYNQFNISVLPEHIRAQGVRLLYPAGTVIISLGDFPDYVYFIESGVALGTRDYNDGNNYFYFRITSENGSVGLLELLARKEMCVATVVAETEVTALRISSAVIYEYLMKDVDMLYRCTYIVANDLYQRSGNDGILYYQKGIDRVRYYLVQHYALHAVTGHPLTVQTDYQTIASNIGVSVRTVVRSVSRLKELSEISVHKKKIMISQEQHEKMQAAIHPLIPSETFKARF